MKQDTEIIARQIVGLVQANVEGTGDTIKTVKEILDNMIRKEE